MAEQIRGSTDDPHVQMTLGKFNEVFEPRWVQAFERGGFTVQFNEEHDKDAVINFAELNGYELKKEQTLAWKEYHFE